MQALDFTEEQLKEYLRYKKESGFAESPVVYMPYIPVMQQEIKFKTKIVWGVNL
jgi:hypothetical protein